MTGRMMKLSVVIVSIACCWLCGCVQPEVTRASFLHETAAPAQEAAPGDHLVLQLGRHADDLLSGPDIDEDQLLVLDVRNFKLNQRLAIPSKEVTAHLGIARFGPPSEGKEYHGFLIVKSITTNEVKVVLNLNVVAETDDNSYTEKTRFNSQYTFFPEQPDNDDELFGKHPLTQ